MTNTNTKYSRSAQLPAVCNVRGQKVAALSSHVLFNTKATNSGHTHRVHYMVYPNGEVAVVLSDTMSDSLYLMTVEEARQDYADRMGQGYTVVDWMKPYQGIGTDEYGRIDFIYPPVENNS